MFVFRFPTHLIQRGRERLSIVPPGLEGSLPVYFCRYTSHNVCLESNLRPQTFPSTPLTARPRNRFQIYPGQMVGTILRLFTHGDSAATY